MRGGVGWGEFDAAAVIDREDFLEVLVESFDQRG